MMTIRVLLCTLLLVGTSPLTLAAPKKSSTGESCIKTGTARKDGKDVSTGQNMNCQWDTCTYCGTSGGKIDCSILKTEYSNPTDCHPARTVNQGSMPKLNTAPLMRVPSR